MCVVREKIKMTNDWRKKEISQGSKHIQDSWTPKPSDELMMLMTVNFLFIIYKPVTVFTSLFLSSCWIAILHIAVLTSFLVFYLWVNQKKSSNWNEKTDTVLAWNRWLSEFNNWHNHRFNSGKGMFELRFLKILCHRVLCISNFYM